MISTQKFWHTSNFRSIPWPSSGDWQPRSEVTDLVYMWPQNRVIHSWKSVSAPVFVQWWLIHSDVYDILYTSFKISLSDIKFTTEGKEDRALAFLDTYTVIQPDGSLKIHIYRKPTHTDKYLNFQSNHPLPHKLCVIQTLHHRADSVITEQED